MHMAWLLAEQRASKSSLKKMEDPHMNQAHSMTHQSCVERRIVFHRPDIRVGQ